MIKFLKILNVKSIIVAEVFRPQLTIVAKFTANSAIRFFGPYVGFLKKGRAHGLGDLD